MDAETQRYIKDQIKQQLNIILNAESGANTSQVETVNALFPGMPGIINRPVMHPFGFVSRAVQGTISVVAKIGSDIQNRMTIGHRDKGRPSDVEEGEMMIYSVGNFRVKISKTQVLVGKGTTYEPLVVGETLRQLLIALIQEIANNETHLGNLGFQTSPPLDALELIDIQTQYLDNKKILAQNGGRF